MLQFSKQMQQHADYGTRVMETETIQKNGTSLKSRMSRGNILMALCFCAFTNKAEGQTWPCGTGNISATLSSSTLTIDGSGAITSTPWDAYKGDIQKLVINNGVTSVPGDAFSGCRGLKTVRIEDGTVVLDMERGGNRFENSPIETLYLGRDMSYYDGRVPFRDNTALKTLTIGKEVISIEQWSFSGCTGLTSVTNNATTPQNINANVFGGVDVGKIPLTVPAGSLALYKAAAVWKDFFSINGQATAIETPETDKFTIYRNPAKDEIFIRSEEPIEKVEIQDIAGKKIINYQLSIQ